MTVVTVVAIAAVGAFFYAFVWPVIQTTILQSTYCATAYDCTEEGQPEGKVGCKYQDKDGAEKTITCSINDQSNTIN